MPETNNTKSPLTLKTLAERIEAQDARSEELSDALHELNLKMSESAEDASAKFDQILAAMSGMRAADRPVTSGRRETEYFEHGASEADPAHFSNDIGDGTERPRLVVPTGPVDVDSPSFREYAENERFLREPVTVVIQRGGEEYAEDPVVLHHQGRPYAIPLETPTQVPRFVVEVLARAKPIGYGNEEVVQNGIRRMIHRPKTRVRYPFATQGDSEAGNAWLRSIQAQR